MGPQDYFKLLQKSDTRSPRDSFKLLQKADKMVSKIVLSYFNKKTQGIPEILSKYFKNKTRFMRIFFKLLQKLDKSGPRDSFKVCTSKTTEKWSLRFFQTTSKTSHM